MAFGFDRGTDSAWALLLLGYDGKGWGLVSASVARDSRSNLRFSEQGDVWKFLVTGKKMPG